VPQIFTRHRAKNQGPVHRFRSQVEARHIASRDYKLYLVLETSGLSGTTRRYSEHAIASVTMASSQPAHKPRRRRRQTDLASSSLASYTIETFDDGTKRPNFPLVAFLWPAKGSVSQWIVLPCILMAVGLFRWATGFWGYSGMLWHRARGKALLTSL
jgi:hypothetical protein